jgi:hypothetical protein
MKVLFRILLFVPVFSLPFMLFAQLRLPVSNAFQNDIEKLITDYPNHFKNYLGDPIVQNPQSTDYECTLKVDGAEESNITQYSGKKQLCSWQGVMLTTDDFETAKKKFKSLFSQLNNLRVKFSSIRSYSLKGSYESPEEEKSFTTTLFSFDGADPSLQKLKVQLSMEYLAMEWKVKVLVYEKEREDDEQGDTKDE